MTMGNDMTEDQIKALNEIYIEIEHCMIVDSEVTLNCNGTNAHEASNVIDAVYDALGLEYPKATKESLAAFCEYHGYDFEDHEWYFNED